MKDRIIDILQNSDKALTAYELESMLNLISSEEVKDMLEALRSLEKDAIIYHSNKDKYLMLKDSHLNRGIMRANKKGFGFVDIDDNDEDVYIKEESKSKKDVLRHNYIKFFIYFRYIFHRHIYICNII